MSSGGLPGRPHTQALVSTTILPLFQREHYFGNEPVVSLLGQAINLSLPFTILAAELALSQI